MGIYIASNSSSVDAMHKMQELQRQQAQNLSRLSSSANLNNSADDAEGLGVSTAQRHTGAAPNKQSPVENSHASGKNVETASDALHRQLRMEDAQLRKAAEEVEASRLPRPPAPPDSLAALRAISAYRNQSDRASNADIGGDGT